MENTKKVAIIMGSDSDWPTVKAAAVQLKSWDIPFEVRVMSAHRTPAAAAEFAKRAAENGFGVIIAAAGMATVALNGAKNAAVLAAQMLAIHDARIAALLAEDREKMARSIAEKDAAIRAEAAAL